MMMTIIVKKVPTHLHEKAHPDPGIVMDLGSIGLLGTTNPA